MDSFLKSLLVEKSLNLYDDCSCVVVMDNAKLHHESWSEMPRRMRKTLALKSDAISTAPLKRKKKKPGVKRSTTHPARRNMEDPGQTRWGSAAQKKQQSASTGPVPAPPSCPQRQASTGPVPAPPCCPQRQKSIEVTTPHNCCSFKNSPSSVLEPLTEEGPRKPQRQASMALDTDNLPPLPMPMTLAPPARSKSNDAVFLSPEFSRHVKRSRGSLLDDDDSDYEDERRCDMALLEASIVSL